MNANAVMVSVVVPTCFRTDLLRRCLDALVAQSFDHAHFEIVVVDDGPSGETARLIGEFQQRLTPAIRYLATSGRCGPAVARNRGWRSSAAAIIAFTDDDTIPDPDWIREGVAAMASGASVVTGKVIVPLPPQPSDHERNTVGLERADFVTANCFCTHATLETVGGFDERFTSAWREDSDLHFRFLDQRISITKAERAVVCHPVRDANWGISLRQQRNNLFEALLYKKHPALYRTLIGGRPVSYYAIVVAACGVIAGLLTRNNIVAFTSASICLLGTAEFIFRRIGHTKRTPAHMAEMLITSALIPPVAVFWRLRGAWRWRTWFW